MATMTKENPISDLTYDWLTILQNKAEGVAAYEKYIQDAESQNATECIQMLKKIQKRDVEQLEEIKQHVFGMISQNCSHG